MFTPFFFSALAASFVAAAPSSCDLVPSSIPSPPVSGSGNGTSSTSFVASAWYPGWGTANSPLSNINWQKYSLITWAFAVTTENTSVSLEASGASYIPQFVQEAHAHGTMASISVGGWTGSQFFSSAVTPQNRSTFVKAVLDMASKYQLDGIDFDWEYPNGLGIGCNEGSVDDAANYLAFLQQLRTQPAAKNLLLTAAVGPTTFLGPDKQPMTDVSEFAKVLDHIAIMSYDINGQWSTSVGPNAPLDDSCSTLKTGSATAAVKAWTAAGFPAEKIVLGVPSYGHSFTVSPSSAVDASGNLAPNPPFTKNTNTSGVDQCGNPAPAVDTKTFADMITGGLLNDDGTPANGMKYLFDKCSQTPFLYDETNQLMVSYDDPTSFAAKGKFIVENNLLGYAMWDLTGDPKNTLSDSLATAAGVSDC